MQTALLVDELLLNVAEIVWHKQIPATMTRPQREYARSHTLLGRCIGRYLKNGVCRSSLVSFDENNDRSLIMAATWTNSARHRATCSWSLASVEAARIRRQCEGGSLTLGVASIEMDVART